MAKTATGTSVVKVDAKGVLTKELNARLRELVAEGIEKVDEIASTPGVDAIYIGPTDLALALGLPPVMDNDDPKHVATVNRILEACKRHKTVPGIHTTSSKFTQRYLDQGFQMVMLGADRVAMSNYMKAEVARLTGWTPMAPGSGANSGGY